MRIRFLAKLGILLLAVVFLASMAPYSIPHGKGQAKVKGKPIKPPTPGDTEDTRELYKVTITINPDFNGFGFSSDCTPTHNYFYAEKKKGKFLFELTSDGIKTPGPGPEYESVPLTMNVISGLPTNPYSVEGCTWWDGCHGNPEPGTQNDQFAAAYPDWDVSDYTFERGYEWIFIRFLKDQDCEGPNQDVQFRWWFDYIPGPKDHGIGWTIHYQFDWLGNGEYVKTTNYFPPQGLVQGEQWETDIYGTFWILHDGIGLNDSEPDRVPMPDCSIHLMIQRIQ